MRFNRYIFVLLWCLAVCNRVNTNDKDMQKLLEAQFLNVTEDIKIGAVELDLNPEEVEIVEVL